MLEGRGFSRAANKRDQPAEYELCGEIHVELHLGVTIMARILVVDDSAVDRKLAGGLLQKNPDWQVFYANDGKQALQEIELHLPDLVLTDLQMPEMNGLELVTKVREEFPMVPIILMTAKGSEEIAVQALQHGAAYYVPKKMLSQELAEVVERTLHTAKESRSQSRLLRRMIRSDTTFELENDLTLIPSVVGYLQDIVTQMRTCEETDRLRVGVALEEALLNAYYHGNLEVSSELREQDHSSYYNLAQERSQMEPYRARRITVEASVTPTESRYVIRDEGPGFNPADLPDPTDPANIERPCGRGLLLMQTFMDAVKYNPIGNEVTMIKRRAEKAAPAGREM
jgi:CheY-like chemotaxis protein/anti-sigma regulatory factor (Ser/Thr protein kinase)